MFVIGSRSFTSLDQLESLVIKLATQYDKEGYAEDFDGNPVSDPEYDVLYKVLKRDMPGSKAFKGTSPSEKAASDKVVVHNPPMTSIAKADGDDRQKIYEKWKDDCLKRLGVKTLEFTEAMKRDGIAVRINYVNGKLVSAGLRPQDGVHGTDVTEHIKYVDGVFQKLPLPLTLSLQGELECWKADFEKINAECDEAGEEPYKNPRNYVAGVMGRDDAEQVKGSRIRITYHGVVGFADWQDHYTTEIERAKWVNQEHGLNLQKDGYGYFVQIRPHKFEDLAKMEAGAADLPYEVDGVVMKVNNLDDQEQLGNSGDDPVKPPRGALAWKFVEPTALPVNKHLEWNASRTGRIVPTSIFESPVFLAGTSVSKATANNYGWVKAMGIGPGTILEVKKAGKIIPNIIRVVDKAVKTVQCPTHCPTCGYKLRVHTSDSGNQDLMCDNPDCGAKHVKSWVFYFQSMGGKGLGASAMEKILQGGKTKSLADLYELEVDELVDAGFSERQALLALATIFMVKPVKDDEKLAKSILSARKKKQPVQAWQFFAALGIPGAGRTSGKALVDYFHDFDKIRTASEDTLLDVPGIGEITAKAIYNYFQENNNLVDRLLKHVELELPKTGRMTGQTYVLTGSFTPNKDHYHKLIEGLGGKVGSSVGRGTTALVLGDPPDPNKPTTKELAAQKHGVPTMTADELAKLLV